MPALLAVAVPMALFAAANHAIDPAYVGQRVALVEEQSGLSVAPLGVRVIASPSSLDIGSTTNLTALASGGIAPFNFSWGGLPAGCSGTNRSSLDCTPSAAGTFEVSVTVVDSAGHTAANSTIVSVANPSPFLSIFSTLGPYAVAAGAGALGAFLTILALVLRRRRRRKNAPLILYTEHPYVPPPTEPPP